MSQINKPLRGSGARLKKMFLAKGQGLYARAFVALRGKEVEFDAEFYLNQYPDIRDAGVDPFSHFVFHGQKEGRVGKSPTLATESEFAQLDPARETVMVISHEASRTGAPVLSLNLIIELKRRYNVIAMILGGGELEEEFRLSGALVIDSKGLRASPDHARLLMDKICRACPIKYAIVNSVESRVVLTGLAANFIPTLTLIHEFTAYTRPKTAFLEAMFWSTRTVYSSKVIHQSAVRELPVLAHCPVEILPQGRCEVTFSETDLESLRHEEERLRSVFLQLKGDHKRIVLGAGLIQLRKGVDLFIDCATRILELGEMDNLHFVWVGKGYDPERDIQYSAYLYDQVLRAGLENHVTFIPETTAIKVAYEEASAVLITSRLDPLPNVAIDAMSVGLPVLCFDRTTGIVDVLEACGEAEACVARYLHVPDMATKLIALLGDPEAFSRVSKVMQAHATQAFSMPAYIAGLEEVALGAIAQARQERLDYETIAASGLYRSDFIPRYLRSPSEFDTLRTFIRAWATQIEERKLFPGFHPGIFAEQSDDYVVGHDPLASYIRAGQPNGPWRSDLLTPSSPVSSIPPGTRIAMHVHVFYADLFEEMLACLARNTVRPDLFLSVPTEQVKSALEEICKAYDGKVIAIEVVPNKGRDIGPFISAFGKRHLREYDIVGHLHTKKSKHQDNPEVGRIWYDFLLENLLGKEFPMADIIISRMLQDPEVGIVFADDPHIVDWGLNLPYAQVLQEKIGMPVLPRHIVFPVGTMFWVRADSLRLLDDQGLSWSDYPEEPTPYDGSILHALERLVPLVAKHHGHSLVLTNIKNITR
ncbi:rhamnan synthesis F family protein [Pseudomonas sp. dw_358]|uniref:rhamnan synthesis F family protein n=1 Tax=Pseudomonas sp. dw_358 TaxID=2720083 RepID=UPI001BD5E6D5|nr:rhamnan synthesis F family protein [Pseudomonas sp. dw_358]